MSECEKCVPSARCKGCPRFPDVTPFPTDALPDDDLMPLGETPPNPLPPISELEQFVRDDSSKFAYKPIALPPPVQKKPVRLYFGMTFQLMIFLLSGLIASAITLYLCIK